MYYYGARWYDAFSGRFISADTIVPDAGNPQDLNRYSYVRNNPVKYTDPSGHIPIPLLTGAIGTVAGAGLYIWNESRQSDGFSLSEDWADLTVASAAGAVSGAMIMTPVGMGMAVTQVGDHVNNLLVGEDFSAGVHLVESAVGGSSAFMGSTTARIVARTSTSIATQCAAGVGTAILVEGPGEYVIDSVADEGSWNSIAYGTAFALIGKAAYEPYVERGAKGLSATEATIWNTGFGILFEANKGLIGGGGHLLHEYYSGHFMQ